MKPTQPKTNTKVRNLLEKERKEKTGHLDLSNCGLREVPTEIEHMTWLSSLDLSTTSVREIVKSNQPKAQNNSIGYVPEFLAKLSKLSKLDLSGNEIRTTDSFYGLKQIKSLDLSKNNVDNILSIGALESVETLDLSSNNLSSSSISDLGILHHLVKLDLSHNNISYINQDFLPEQLIELNLSENSLLGQVDVSFSQNIEYLNLSNNKISSLVGLEQLKKLNYLDLSKNVIHGSLDLTHNPNLKELIVQHNLLVHIICQSKTIERIKAGFNQLESIPDCTSSSLKYLFLNHNEIKSISDLEAFKVLVSQLEEIDIRDNPISEDWLDKETLNIVGFNIGLLKQRLETALLKNITAEVEFPSKIIMMGNSEVGKTTLSNLLTDKKTKGTASTHGLKIEHWKDKKVFIYDFGGQDYYHSVYQIFMTIYSQYIIVWDAERNFNSLIEKDRSGQEIDRDHNYINYNLSYWLYNIKYFFDKQKEQFKNNQQVNISVATVQNMFRESTKRSYLGNTVYPIEIDHQFNLSLVNGNQMDLSELSTLQHYLDQSIALNQPKIKLSDHEKEVVKALLIRFGETKAYTKIKVSALHEEFGDRLEFVLRLCHQRGLILYFPDCENIENFIWINPSFVSKQIYNILTKNALVKDTGKILISNLNKSIHDAALLNLMLYKNIMFEDMISQERFYIIPQYLPQKPKKDPLYALAISGLQLTYQLKFDSFVPHGLMGNIICRIGSGNEVKNKYYYRNEMIFGLTYHDQEYKVRIANNPIYLTLSIYILGADQGIEDIKEYIFKSIISAYWNRPHLSLTQFIDQSTLSENEYNSYNRKRKKKMTNNELMSWNSVAFFDQIPKDLSISLDGKHYVPYAQFEKNEDQEIAKTVIANLITDGNETKRYDRSIFNAFCYRKSRAIKKVFISYSHDDIAFKQEVQKYLVNLEREFLIEIWQDGLIRPGDAWNSKIQNALQEADIVILLITQSFISSTYVHEKEMPEAINKVREKRGDIIPLVLSECDWSQWKVLPDYKIPPSGEKIPELGDYQALPHTEERRLKPLNQWEFPDRAWMQLVNYLRSITQNN